MENFYKECKRYKKLLKNLEDSGKEGYYLAEDLIDVVGKAIQHGISEVEKKLNKIRRTK